MSLSSLVPVSLSPDEIIARFSVRPRGGEHRADGPAETRPLRSHGPGSRIEEAGSGGRLLDAFDAAKILGAHCFVWQPEAMLEHPEIAQLGLNEATGRLRSEVKALGWRARMSREGREQLADLNGQLRELHQCADILMRAHSDLIISESWRPSE